MATASKINRETSFTLSLTLRARPGHAGLSYFDGSVFEMYGFTSRFVGLLMTSD